VQQSYSDRATACAPRGSGAGWLLVRNPCYSLISGSDRYAGCARNANFTGRISIRTVAEARGSVFFTLLPGNIRSRTPVRLTVMAHSAIEPSNTNRGLILLTGATGSSEGACSRRLWRPDAECGVWPDALTFSSRGLLPAHRSREPIAWLPILWPLPWQGVHTACYLVHSMSSAGNFEEDDRRAGRNFSAAAREAGVKNCERVSRI
jgi:hypothetical protein